MPKKTAGAKKTPLSYNRTNGYEKISPLDLRKLEETAKGYMAFLGSSKTEREAHDEGLSLLQAAGFKDLDALIAVREKLKPGDKVYKSWYGKTLLAAILGRRPLEDGLQIIGGHTDSPRLDVKQNPLYEGGELALLDTHYYGGIKKYQWTALPLALHGVFVKRDGSKIAVKVGEEPGDPVFFISDLLPHMAADQMKKTLAEGIEGEGLDVIVGSIPCKGKKQKEKIKYRVLELLKEKYGVSEADFLSAELEFVPAGMPREVGFDRSMILGYGHDDRACAYAALRALLDIEKTPEFAACVVLCDKEEIGSYGATGMESNFFENTVSELLALEKGAHEGLAVRRALARSWMISADVNSLYDPLYPGVSEKKNVSYINQGTSLSKYGGARGKSGSSDANAEFVAEIRRIFDKAGVLWQTGELGKVDAGGGGTIALCMARYGMCVIDCGVGVISMHSPWELVGKLDVYMSVKGFKAFLKDERGSFSSRSSSQALREAGEGGRKRK
ncbi:MAG: aminopeptidase [Elusimicrobia bacterium]|nr:aminopeptidase [Elusimicrobiota bacterium]